MLKKLKSIKTKAQVKYAAFEINATKFIDKHKVVRRAFMLGILVNVYLSYNGLKKLAVLKQIEQYIDLRKRQFNKTFEIEKERILQIVIKQDVAQQPT